MSERINKDTLITWVSQQTGKDAEIVTINRRNDTTRF
jgi:hypothetical protein